MPSCLVAEMTNNNSLLLSLLLLPLLFRPYVNSQSELIHTLCSNNLGNYTANTTYRSNLNNLLTSIAAAQNPPTIPGFYNFSTGRDPNRAHGFGLCRGDVRPDNCRSCVADSANQILNHCPNQKEASSFAESCTVLYSTRSEFGVLEPSLSYRECNEKAAPEPSRFNSTLVTLLTRLRAATVAGGRFANGTEGQGDERIYGLTQCAPDLSARVCGGCLDAAFAQIRGYCVREIGWRMGGKIVSPNCYLRFETYKFFSEPSAPPPPPPVVPTTTMDTKNLTTDNTTLGTDGGSKGKSTSTRTIVIAVLISLFGALTLAFIVCRIRTRLKTANQMSGQIDRSKQ